MNPKNEKLARWLHEQYRNAPDSDGRRFPWDDLSDRHRGWYLHVARQLVDNPPLEIRKAVRELEGL